MRFDVYMLFRYLKHDRNSCEVIELVDNPGMMHVILHWLKLISMIANKFGQAMHWVNFN